MKHAANCMGYLCTCSERELQYSESEALRKKLEELSEENKRLMELILSKNEILDLSARHSALL